MKQLIMAGLFLLLPVWSTADEWTPWAKLSDGKLNGLQFSPRSECTSSRKECALLWRIMSNYEEPLMTEVTITWDSGKSLKNVIQRVKLQPGENISAAFSVSGMALEEVSVRVLAEPGLLQHQVQQEQIRPLQDELRQAEQTRTQKKEEELRSEQARKQKRDEVRRNEQPRKQKKEKELRSEQARKQKQVEELRSEQARKQKHDQELRSELARNQKQVEELRSELARKQKQDEELRSELARKQKQDEEQRRSEQAREREREAQLRALLERKQEQPARRPMEETGKKQQESPLDLARQEFREITPSASRDERGESDERKNYTFAKPATDCITTFINTKLHNWLAYRNNCSTKLHVFYSNPGFGSLEIDAGQVETSGWECGDGCLPSFGACPEGYTVLNTALEIYTPLMQREREPFMCGKLK